MVGQLRILLLATLLASLQLDHLLFVESQQDEGTMITMDDTSAPQDGGSTAAPVDATTAQTENGATTTIPDDGETAAPDVGTALPGEAGIPGGETAPPSGAGGEEATAATDISTPATEVPNGGVTFPPAPPAFQCDNESIDFAYFKTRPVRDVFLEKTELSKFRESLTALGLFDTLLNDPDAQLTIIAPRNHAIEASEPWMTYLKKFKNWMMNLRHTVYNHILEDQALSKEELEAGVHLSMEDNLYGNINSQSIDSVKIVCTIPASNGYVHIVDSILTPKFFNDDLSELEIMPEFGPDRDQADRTSLVTVVDFLDARYMYERRLPNGMTNVGCRIRAFNRINDYHKWTINQAESDSLIWGEFLNETFKNESFHNFIEYNIIEKVYNVDDLDNLYEELIMSTNWCAHMWVTKHQDKICFNNACLVIAPPAFSKIGTPASRRIQIASNG